MFKHGDPEVNRKMAPIRNQGKLDLKQQPSVVLDMNTNTSQSYNWVRKDDDIDIEVTQSSSRCRHNSYGNCDNETGNFAMDNAKEFQNDFLKQSGSAKLNRSSSVYIEEFDISEQECEIIHSYLSMHGEDGKASSQAIEQSLKSLKPKDKTQFRIIRNVNTQSNKFLWPAVLIMSWFLLSFLTIVTNKYILSTLGGDIGILAECQLLMTTLFGFVKMYVPCYLAKWQTSKHHSFSRFHFLKSMAILGWLRFGSVICSVVSLKYMAVSFSETIKSSAPMFTVIVAYIILGEYSGLYTNLSLIPIMLGLAMCFLGEITFSTTGFIASICNNILDCIQNVFSKKLLSGEDKYYPLELQFYTSVAASVVQLPFWVLFMDFKERIETVDQFMVVMLLINGVFFYLQSVTAFMLMSLISPVTFSVSSTVKRAALIWFSVILFGNKVTLMSAIGTVSVVIGVALYQRARIKEAHLREKKQAVMNLKDSAACQ